MQFISNIQKFFDIIFNITKVVDLEIINSIIQTKMFELNICYVEYTLIIKPYRKYDQKATFNSKCY